MILGSCPHRGTSGRWRLHACQFNVDTTDQIFDKAVLALKKMKGPEINPSDTLLDNEEVCPHMMLICYLSHLCLDSQQDDFDDL